METRDDRLEQLVSVLFQAHPWHGVAPGGADGMYRVYVEVVGGEAIKYELDKPSGHLHIDRPQRLSSLSPTPYGFIPQTWCGPRTAARCRDRTGAAVTEGDGDPIDVCVLTEKTVAHGGFLCRARPIGGLRMVDGAQADDKIIAVLDGDVVFGKLRDLDEAPAAVVERLQHYFVSYKQRPAEEARRVLIAETYDAAEARETIACSVADYRERYGAPETRLDELRQLLRNP